MQITKWEMRNAKCEMRNAKCEMRNAKCEMRNAKCEMRNAKCEKKCMKTSSLNNVSSEKKNLYILIRLGSNIKKEEYLINYELTRNYASIV